MPRRRVHPVPSPFKTSAVRPVDNDNDDPALTEVLKDSDVALRIGLSRCRDLVAECREKLVANPFDQPSAGDDGSRARTDRPPG